MFVISSTDLTFTPSGLLKSDAEIKTGSLVPTFISASRSALNTKERNVTKPGFNGLTACVPHGVSDCRVSSL